MDHFLSLADLTAVQLQGLLDTAVSLKQAQRQGDPKPLLAGKTLAMLFQKPSLRTRVSFEMGMVQLGGHALYISPAEVQMGTRETPADVARVLSGYVDGLMARVFAHQDVLELAQYASVPVINGLSDYSHPAQGLADLLTILEHKGGLAGVKLVYVGDGNNVARSLLFGAMLSGMEFVIATPTGYGLAAADFAVADRLKTAGATYVTYEGVEGLPTAVANADVIYTDTWTSMGQEEEKQKRQTLFPPYQVNQQMLQLAHPDCIVMHCLPAYRGSEITAEVADGPHSVIFPQAENRLHAQKAILVELLGQR